MHLPSKRVGAPGADAAGRWYALGMRAPAALLCCCVVGAASAGVAAQTPDPPPRPKIGLALGGGVARGIAHIGVIEWLEEHHVPVDVIAGTSAGGLIGGIYSTGMTPAEMRG